MFLQESSQGLASSGSASAMLPLGSSIAPPIVVIGLDGKPVSSPEQAAGAFACLV